MSTETFIGDGGSANIWPTDGDCYPDGWIGPFDWIERDFGF